jgi:hypothetical protein
MKGLLNDFDIIGRERGKSKRYILRSTCKGVYQQNEQMAGPLGFG